MLIASADALDQFFIRHPGDARRRRSRPSILDHASREIRRRTWPAPPYEAPITEADDAILGDGAYAEALRLAEQGDLARHRGAA